MKPILTLLFVSLLMAGSGCRKMDGPPGECGGGIHPKPLPAPTPQPDNCGTLLTYSEIAAHHNDAFTIDKVYLDGDYLKIGVHYAGTQPHPFQLVWNDASMKPQTVLQLEHDNLGETNSKAPVYMSVCYNISRLQVKGAHEVSFLLAGWNDKLVYTY